jgi:Cft2 family RNA processing exonuclease
MKGVKFCPISGCGINNIDASLFEITIDGDNLILDAGYMEGMKIPSVFSQLQHFEPPICILVTHAHLDHLGFIPCLHMLYPNAQIISTAPTIAFAPTMLDDAQSLSPDLHDAIHDLSGISRAGSERAILDTLSAAKTNQISFGETRIINGTRITAFKAGHIPGAASFLIEGREGTRVYYTGDFSTVDFLTVEAPCDFLKSRQQIDLLICESTYGDRGGPNREEEIKEFITKINNILEQGGRVLVPSFALGRAQEILAILRRSILKNELREKTRILLAGMAKRVTLTYDNLDDRFKPSLLCTTIGRLADSDSVILVPDNKAKEVALSQNAPCVFVATSGRLKGGPSESIAQEILKEPNSGILFVGHLD